MATGFHKPNSDSSDRKSNDSEKDKLRQSKIDNERSSSNSSREEGDNPRLKSGFGKKSEFSGDRRSDSESRGFARSRHDGEGHNFENKSRGRREGDRGFSRPSHEGGDNPRLKSGFGKKSEFSGKRRSDSESRGFGRSRHEDEGRDFENKSRGKREGDRGFARPSREGGDNPRLKSGFGKKSEFSGDRRSDSESRGFDRSRHEDEGRRSSRFQSRGFEKQDDSNLDHDLDKPQKSFGAFYKGESSAKKEIEKPSIQTPKKEKRRFKPPTAPDLDPKKITEPLRLNKYIARSTSYTRREADELIKSGRVRVNDEIVSPGYKVKKGDVVLFDEKRLERKDHIVFILINKPINVTTSATKEEGQKSIADLLKFSGAESLTPVFPLQDHMMGLQLLTNDKSITKHFLKNLPKSTYTINFKEGLDEKQLQKIIDFTDSQSKVVDLQVLDEENKSVSIVVRGTYPSRLFSKLGTELERVDRLHFAGLTKKDLPRGYWRFLSEKEVTWITVFQQ